MKRKVIQISTCEIANTYHTQCNMITTALCDDGSMWSIRDNVSSVWERLPNIPNQGAEAVEDEVKND